MTNDESVDHHVHVYCVKTGLPLDVQTNLEVKRLLSLSSIDSSSRSEEGSGGQ